MTQDSNIIMPKRALISVSDKSGVVQFARFLAERGVELISTGGTLKHLKDEGLLSVRSVESVTGFPEMMDGRLKTLHPKIHGAILALREKPEHVAAMEGHGIEPIDMVVVNLYPFKAKVEEGAPHEEVIENIDIGGPAMLRSAAKNYKHIAVVVSPNDYPATVDQLLSGGTSLRFRDRLAQRVFEHTAAYDLAVATYFGDHRLTSESV